jgi:UDP-N-acetylmuramate dehydrogenase
MPILNQLQQNFPELDFKPQYLLTKQTYFKIGGQAEVYLELSRKDQILKIISFCRENNIKFTILGGASNVVISDDGISGLVLHLKNDQLVELNQTIQDEKHLIKVGAGLKTSLLVKKTVDLGYAGLEFFLGVPGTVGGAVFNNAHYLENLISDYIHRVEIINNLGNIEIIAADECEFGYDSSRFHHTGETILEVIFALKKGSLKKSQDLIKKATQYRAETQPLGLPSSGCIFKNTPNSPELKKLFPIFENRNFVSAGFLIDQAGLKGIRVGGVEVSTKHAAFFINSGNGTAADLKKLIGMVKKQVKDKFDIELEEEVFYLS